MKKRNLASMLAVAGGLTLATAACSGQSEAPAQETTEVASCSAAGCAAAAREAKPCAAAACEAKPCAAAACEAKPCAAKPCAAKPCAPKA